MVDARREDAVAAQTVDVLTPEEIAKHGALTGPLERRELPCLRYGLPVREETPVEVLLVAVDRLRDEGLLFGGGHLATRDQAQIPLAELQHIVIRQPQLIGAPFSGKVQACVGPGTGSG
jgi:hypothetical protein